MSVYISEGSRKMARNLDDLLERWKIRKEKKEINIVQKFVEVEAVEKVAERERYVATDEFISRVKELGLDEYNQLFSELLASNNDIKFQINSYNRDIARNQSSYGAEWISEARYIQGTYAALLQAMLMAKSQNARVREEIHEYKISLPKRKKMIAEYFMMVAHDHITQELFSQIFAEAKEKFKLQEETGDVWSPSDEETTPGE